MKIVKVCLHVTVLTHFRYYHNYQMCSFYCHQNIGERIGLSPILSVIHVIIIGIMLNANGGNNGHGLRNVTCEQAFKVFTAQ